MSEEIKALPPEGSTKCTQKRDLTGGSMGRYRLFLAMTLGFCLLLVDGFLWHGPSAGLTATVLAWYALTLAWTGPRVLERRSSRALLLANLFLAATMALGSNWYFRCWNLLALIVLIPVHAMAGLASRPWWDPWMLIERLKLLFQGLFGNLWACFAAAVPDKRTEEKPKRTMAVVLGLCGAVALVSVLLPVLISADALFAASVEALNWDIRMLHFSDGLQRLFWALVFTPFVFSLPWPIPNGCARRRRRRASGWTLWASCWPWRRWMDCTWPSWRCSPPGCSAVRSMWRVWGSATPSGPGAAFSRWQG